MRGFVGQEGEEDDGQCRKDQGLDESRKKFKTEERYGDEIGHQEAGNNEQDFAGEDVAEETERERDYFGHFADEFQYAYEKIYWAGKVDVA